MARKKQYTDPSFYEGKLDRVMERFGIPDENYNYNFDRFSAYIQFRYKGEVYRFDLTTQKADDLVYGSDCFARIVLSLEDLARMVERGIYDLSTWVAGMRYLPPAVDIPDYFKFLGFTEIPETVEEIDQRYKKLSKTYHPDQGGSSEQFTNLQNATIKAKKHLGA